MLHGEIVGHGAAIVCVSGFRMSVACESDAICFIEGRWMGIKDLD